MRYLLPHHAQGDEMTRKQSVEQHRRDFLKGVAAAGGAVALAAASRNAISGSAETPSEANESAESKGYRKTSHVKAFYASARI